MNYPQKVLEALQFKRWPRPGWNLPQLQSHRGFWVGGARENSLASLAEAKNQKFQMAELDVRLSADQVPVVMHDKNLVRLFSVRLRVANLSADELSRWEIPTLSEVLRTKARPPLLNIEIKNDERLDGVLEKRVIEVVRGSRKKGEVIFSAFNPLSLKVCAEEMPEVPRALLIALDRWKKISYLRLVGNMVAQAHMVNWPQELLTEKLVALQKSAGLFVGAWTVNDHRRAKQFQNWGVDTLITDRILPGALASAAP